MYEYLSGEVVRITPQYAVLEVAGVGHRLRAPSGTLEKLREGAPARIFVSHRIRDEQLVLFGFALPAERDFFEQICQVSGVGPASAIALLSQIDQERLRTEVLEGRTEELEKVKGIGRKTAQRIILDLRGALEKEDLASRAGSPAAAGIAEGPPADAVRALQVLGFQLSDAQERVRQALSGNPDVASAEDLVRLASRRR